MKTANDFAKTASAATALADKIRPTDSDVKYANNRLLIVYHLRAAAALARTIAEDMPK